MSQEGILAHLILAHFLTKDVLLRPLKAYYFVILGLAHFFAQECMLSDNDFPKYSPSPCGYVRHGSMTVSQTIPSEDSMVTRNSALGLYAPRFPLTPLIFSRFTKLWDGERP